MRTRYTYLGDNVVEVVVGEESVEVNILPAGGSQPEPPSAAASQPEQDSVEPPLAGPLEFCASPPPPTRRERGVMAGIRAMWVWVLGLAAAIATVAIDLVAGLGLPQWAVGAIILFCTGILYAAKRFTWPNSKF